MKPVNVIAIFDIGKTNKKFFLLDEAYNIVLEEATPFDEIKDEDGDPCDDVGRLTKWVHASLDAVLQLKDFDIKAVNFSAYGASLVYIDETGKAIAPLYNYLKTYPDTLKDALYEKYGGAERVSRETASPILGSLNSGMQLYRILKEKPELYNSIQYALHLPQYISCLISKNPSSDITSIGCHTQLWNFEKNSYHEWVKAEGLDKKLAPLKPSNAADTISYQHKQLKVGTGLHDSSAALIPYLAVFSEPFILLSTGTWCIALNPFNDTPLTTEELGKDCLCYMDYTGAPVKASRLFAGYEHEQQTKRLAAHFKTPVDYYKQVKYTPSIIAALQERTDFHETPVPGNPSGFGERDLNLFSDYETAYHCLMLDIIRQQYQSVQLVMHGTHVTRIFVDGGFSNNPIYMHLLSAAFPHVEVYAASVAQATAMGAALAIHHEWNTQPIPASMVKLRHYKVGDSLQVVQ